MRRVVGTVVCVVALIVGAGSATAATTTITVGPNGTLTFSPANATVHVGDTVKWVWSTGFHSSTSGSPPGTPDGKWDSQPHSEPFTFKQTFTHGGTFQYYCSIHYSLGMVGSVTVLPLVPRVWISNGAGNSASLFEAGATGNAAPPATIAGALTGLSDPFGLALDATGRLRVASANANSLSLFGAGASGNVAPISKISGSRTGLASPEGLT